MHKYDMVSSFRVEKVQARVCLKKNVHSIASLLFFFRYTSETKGRWMQSDFRAISQVSSSPSTPIGQKIYLQKWL